MNKVIGMFTAAGLLIAGQAFAAAGTYTIDPAHSSIDFSVKHMMISTITGSFDDFKGSITYDPAAPADFKAEATIQAKSIDTHQEKRDAHLRTGDFFDVEKFPTITFAGKTLTGSGGKYTLTGDLTMKGVTKEVTIPVTIDGPVKGAMGGPAIGLNGTLTINRQDYGINYNKTLDTGGLAVGNDVNITVNIEADNK